MATYKAQALVMPNGDEIKYDESVFVAEYGATSWEEVNAAYEAGKALFCKWGDTVFTLLHMEGEFVFVKSGSYTRPWVSVSLASGGATDWTYGEYKNFAYPNTTVNPASGYYLTVASTTATISRSTITFGSSATQYLSNKGTWVNIPVTSVNGQTGAVSLTIPTVPTNVSAFNNDSGYLTLATLPIWDRGVI